jgi:peptide-methionine (S)-S-oxide reductase
MFWASHRPDREAYSTQYMAAAFPNAAQLDLAIATRDKLRAKTPVIENAPFYLAEDYHQKYYLRHDRTLMRELEGYTPAQLVDSTVAARLNAFAAGHGTIAALDGLDLSTETERYLRSRIGGRRINCG